MTPHEMGRIHRAAFVSERPWRADEFADLLAQPYTHAITAIGGFALTRTLAGESELLTLAVSPARQRHGIARALLRQWLALASTTAETAFLEVAADNAPAIALYTKIGFRPNGLRKNYYTRADAAPVDAVLMTQALTLG